MLKPKEKEQPKPGETWITNKKTLEHQANLLRYLHEETDVSPDSHRKSANIAQQMKQTTKDYMASKKISLGLLPGLESQKDYTDIRYPINSTKHEDSKSKRLFNAKQNNFIKGSKLTHPVPGEASEGVSQKVASMLGFAKQVPSRVRQDTKTGSSLIMANCSLRNVSESNQKYSISKKESKTDSYRCVTDKTIDWSQGLTRIDTVPKHKLDLPEKSTDFNSRVRKNNSHGFKTTN